MNFQYLTDERGRRKAVQISIRDWVAYQEHLEKLEQIAKLTKELKSAFTDIREVQKGRRKPLTMADVINAL